MAKVQNRIWRCPDCEGGIRAPSRLRKVDARRYCLDCTAQTGKLVERVCVARETKKRQVSERTKQALERAKQTVAEEMKLYPWVLYTLFNKWQDLDAWDDASRFDGAALNIRRSKIDSPTWSYNSTHKIIGLTTGEDPFEALAMLLWGMAGFTSKAGEEHLASFLRAVREITGHEVPGDPQHSWDRAVQVLRDNFKFRGISKRQKMPVPKPRKKRKRSTKPKKSKAQKAFASREKDAEW